MRLPLASHTGQQQHPGVAVGRGCPGVRGAHSRGGGGAAHMEFQLCGWVAVMMQQEQKSSKVRQGGDQYWISGNE